ncbi:MAG: hypothetical protein EOO71_12625 [Myxococcaceae bacterium]|nr:MAG: hypothetical protein EOO71_12625 [Myxococcaceae bacterium]
MSVCALLASSPPSRRPRRRARARPRRRPPRPPRRCLPPRLLRLWRTSTPSSPDRGRRRTSWSSSAWARKAGRWCPPSWWTAARGATC